MAELGCLRKRAARLAAEVVSLPSLDTELVFARAAVERGAAEMRELEEKRRVLKAELDEVRDKGLQVRSVEKDIDLLKQEIKRGRFDLLNFSDVYHSRNSDVKYFCLCSLCRYDEDFLNCYTTCMINTTRLDIEEFESAE